MVHQHLVILSSIDGVTGLLQLQQFANQLVET